MSIIIGQEVRVAGSQGGVRLGLAGRVVLETMNTITIRTEDGRNLMLPKAGTALELSSGKILLGEDIIGRLEDRISARARPGRR